eukprot:EG_transcript_14607
MAGLPALLLLSMLISRGRGGVSSPTTMAQVTLRDEIGALLEAENMTVGAELGVQRGWFSLHTLSRWHSCKRYYLVDIWRPQENYAEAANVPLPKQEEYLAETRKRLEAFSSKTVFLRMYTNEAVKHIPDNSLDFVYIDARHDYCGAKEDILNYWPKLRPGGIFAGHDFYYANHPTVGNNDWYLCQNGERYLEAVKGAVVEFAQKRSLPICVTKESWPSWLIRKPLQGGAPEPGCMAPDDAATHNERSQIPHRLRRRQHRTP